MSGHSHGSLHNPDTAHETSDINVRAIIWFVTVLTAIVLAMNVSMWAMFRVLQHYERKFEPAVSPLAPPAAGVKDFPAPSLQTQPWQDLREFRAAQQNALRGYGWVDEKLGVAHIPIARAKELLLQRGMTVRPELADATEGTHVAATGESNSGRLIPAGGPDRSGAAVPQGAAPAATPAAAPAAPKPAKAGGEEK